MTYMLFKLTLVQKYFARIPMIISRTTGPRSDFHINSGSFFLLNLMSLKFNFLQIWTCHGHSSCFYDSNVSKESTH